MMKIIHGIALMATAALMTACTGKNEWTVNGQIEGADDQTLLLEASTNGRWYALDSVKLPKSGNFTISHKAAGYPDIYRLRLADKTLYFPIDSIETVTVVSRADAFDKEYTLDGSDAAQRLMSVDRQLMAALAGNSGQGIQTDSVLKRELAKIMLADPAGIVSYYILNKKLNGKPLYDPTNKTDIRIIGAVANAFDQYRPNDPRTAYLKRLFLSSRQPSATQTVTAEEVPLIDILLYDDKGQMQKLSDAAAANKVVVLNFTVYSAEAAPAYNIELNKAYERFHDRGMTIYQVSVDPDEYVWKQAARTLPWITVYNPSTASAENLLKYNVTALPTTFIVANGEIAERVDDITTLQQSLARYL